MSKGTPTEQERELAREIILRDRKGASFSDSIDAIVAALAAGAHGELAEIQQCDKCDLCEDHHQ